MAENAYEVLRSVHPLLVGVVLDKSEEISKFLMLMYSHIVYAASERQEDPNDLVGIVSIVKDDRLLMVQLGYKPKSDSSRLSLTRDPIKRNSSLTSLLNSNSNIRNLAVEVVTILEKWVNDKPYRKQQGLGKVILLNPMFWKNLVFTAEILLRIEFEELVKAKMKWPQEMDLFESTGSGLII